MDAIEQSIKNFIVIFFLPTKRMREKIHSEKLSTGMHGILMTLGAIIIVNIVVGLIFAFVGK